MRTNTQSFFITGTDTDAGKTLASCALLHKASKQGLSTIGIKPVASGCYQSNNDLKNDDAIFLQESSSESLTYKEVNPISLIDPVSPHIAAESMNINISIDKLAHHCHKIKDNCPAPGFVIAEGAGGWLAPITYKDTCSDLARKIAWPVILIAGVKLGWINHTMLTINAIKKDGLHLAGWIACCIDNEMLALEKNLQTLYSLKPEIPCLGVIPWLSTASEKERQKSASSFLDLSRL